MIRLVVFFVIASLTISAGFSSAQGIERSKPAVSTNQEMFTWVSEIVEITKRYPEFRRMGTKGDAATRRYIVEKLRSFGIEDVEEQAYPLKVRQYDEWTLSVEDQDFPCYFMRGAGYTPGRGIRGELVFVGETIDPEVDYAGKIVVFEVLGQAIPGVAAKAIADFVYDPNGTLAKGTFGGKAGPIPSNFPVSYYQASDAGALGMIAILKNYDTGTDRFYSDPSAMVKTRVPGLFLGKYAGEDLVERIRASPSALEATLVVRGRVLKSSSANIIATLPGQKAETIIINTHHDAGWTGGVQDASGISAVLGLARYFSEIPENFRQKTLVFAFDGSHYDWNYPMGANLFAEANPDVMENVVMAIGIEHIAKKFRAEPGGYVDTGEIEPRILFTPPNRILFEATKRAIVANDLHDVLIPKAGALTMFGETQGFFLRGIPSFSYISGPEYLFLADDTLDKVAKDEFEAVVKTFISIIDSVMYLPGSWIQRIDR
ncbi:MAG: M28 family peptidase [Myxococcota bacterium]